MENLGAQDPRWIGEYRLLGKLGEGGMGRVYLARSARGRTVAVKLVQAELARQADFRGRFKREVEAARRVGGQWTAPVLDADTEAEVPWVATGYIGGPSLHSVVAEDFGALPERSLRILANGLSLALRDIHGAGLVHRDLKPSNILITIDGPRVIDFGIARALDAVGTTTGGNLTMTGAVVGSPGFMSPEQVRGEPVTAASDVFCLGSVLAFAATGRQPFGNLDSGMHALMYRIAQEEPDLTGLPEGARGLVTACLRKDPAQRPTVDELVAATQPVADDGEPWLPGGLLARLGRDALQLLEVEAENAQPAAAAPPQVASAYAAPQPGPHTPPGPSAYASPSAYAAPQASAYPVNGSLGPVPQPGRPWQGGYQTPVGYPAQGPGLKPIRGLATALMSMFGIWLALTLTDMSLNFALLDSYFARDAGEIAPEVIAGRRDAVDSMGIGTALTVTVVMVLWLIWFRTAYINSTRLNPGRLRFGSGYAVGAWFIPVAQLWLPKQIANDIWTASVPPGPGRRGRAVLHWWWAFFVVMFLFAPVSGFGGLVGDFATDQRPAVAIKIIDDGIGFLAGVLAFCVVRRISKMQERRAAQPAGQAQQPAGVFGPPAAH
ncbi:protein kinase domain-containing protein [Streptomyces hygroscopicus]|uniref:protein kinase domain-containing protein n=1 Tax=Streptomyces hygroscopicus TaxID=1912 RepID=UPI003699A215